MQAEIDKNRVAKLIEMRKRYTNGQYYVTAREREILIGFLNANNADDVAEKLNISIHTINTHLSRLRFRFGVKNLAALLMRAHTMGFLL